MKSTLLILAAFTTGVEAKCSITKELGCFQDAASHRVLPHEAYFATSRNPQVKMTHELCAEYCCAAGYTGGFSGVEYKGYQCFCGKTFDASKAAGSTSCTDACEGNASQPCGGTNAITIFQANCEYSPPCTSPPSPGPAPGPTTGGFAGCALPTATALPYCDPKLSDEARVADLLQRLTLEEKISILSPTANPFCAIHTPAIPRLGFPPYKWLTEVNSDVQASCSGAPSRCPTVFIGPTGIGASFNRTSWWMKGDSISDELRALQNAQKSLGLSGFGPNINLVSRVRAPARPHGGVLFRPPAGKELSCRLATQLFPNKDASETYQLISKLARQVKDPRYGRNSEVPSEDPFHSGSYAVSYLRGMQQMSSAPRPRMKMLAYVKHYTAYNVEASRFTFVANVSQFTMFDSYLPQYEMAFKEGQASGAMCSYFAPNGVSLCGNAWLLNGMLRGAAPGWARPDAVVESDCSAVVNMIKV